MVIIATTGWLWRGAGRRGRPLALRAHPHRRDLRQRHRTLRIDHRRSDGESPRSIDSFWIV